MAYNETPNLGLRKTIPGSSEKDRSADLDVSYDNTDAHDHTEGNNQVPWNNGLDKSIDFDMIMKAILNAGLIEFINSSGVTTGNSLYVENNEVHFRDINGKVTQITKDGVLNVTGTGNILNITGSASLAYNEIVKTFTFTDDSGTSKASIVVKDISFDNGTGTTALTSSSTGTRTNMLPDKNGILTVEADINTQVSKTYTTPNITDPVLVETLNVIIPTATPDGYTSAVDATDLATWGLNTLLNPPLVTVPDPTALTLDTGSEITGTNSYRYTGELNSGIFTNVLLSGPSFTIDTPGKYTFSTSVKGGPLNTQTSSTNIEGYIVKDNDFNERSAFTNFGSVNDTSVQTVTNTIDISETGSYNVLIYATINTGKVSDFFFDDISLTANFENATIDFDKPVNKITLSADTTILAANKSAGKSTRIIFEDDSMPNPFSTPNFITSALGNERVGYGGIGGYMPLPDSSFATDPIPGYLSFEAYFDGDVDLITNTSSRGETGIMLINSTSSLDTELFINAQTEVIFLNLNSVSDTAPDIRLNSLQIGQRLTVNIDTGFTVPTITWHYGSNSTTSTLEATSRYVATIWSNHGVDSAPGLVVFVCKTID